MTIDEATVWRGDEYVDDLVADLIAEATGTEASNTEEA